MSFENHCYDNFIKKNDIVYDIGAHVGEMALNFLNKGAAKVLAFEPSKKNFIELKKNTEGLNVECYDVAFHDKQYECLTRFKDCRRDTSGDEEQHIKYVQLDNFIISNNLDLPQFVKIDIEGMEGIIYNNIELLLTSSRPLIFTEFHVPARGNTSQDYKDNPHWKYPDEGGYDFNNLKNHKYGFLDSNLSLFKDGDYNPSPGHFQRLFIPLEKIDKYI